MMASGAWLMWMRALLALFTAAVLAIAPARADSWAMPETTIHLSANGQYRFTVVPRDIDNQLAYFEAKVRGETLPESEGPLGRFERFEAGQWVSVWSRGLVNEVSPVDALVSDDGRHVITFDNWHMTGHGDHVVVIYGEGGALVRSLQLVDLVPAYFIDSLPSSVSSIHWRGGDARFLGGERLELPVSGPVTNDFKTDGSYPVIVSLSDGGVDPLAPAVVERVGGRACILHRSAVESFNRFIASERSDLAPLSPGDKNGWEPFLYQAIKRTPLPPPPAEDPEDPFAGMFDNQPFELLADGAYMEEDFRDGFRGALTASAEESPRRLFASRDQAKMVREVQRTARQIKPGELNGVVMIFLADGEHWLEIRDALADSGASLVQIDIGVPIPPLAEHVAELPPLRMIDPACAETVSE